MRNRDAFTLVELLVVVFILAALAASASSLVDVAHDQARTDQSAARLETIRQAILGSHDPAAAISGYVADVGELPRSMRDLLRQRPSPDDIVDYTTTHETAAGLAPITGLGSGWRGPYLRSTSMLLNGPVEFIDGWGNPDLKLTDPLYGLPDELPGHPNFGWEWVESGSMLRITSRGPDGVPDPDPNAVPPPPTTAFNDVSIEIQGDEHLVMLTTLSLHLYVTNVPAVLPVSDELVLRVWFPNGRGGIDWKLSAPSTVRLVDDGSPDAQANRYVTFTFPADTVVPHGVRAIELCYESDGQPTPQPAPIPAGIEQRQYSLVELRARAGLPVSLQRRFTVTLRP